LLFAPGSSSFAQLYSSFINQFIGFEGDGNIFIDLSRPFGMVKPGLVCIKSSNSVYVTDSTQTINRFSQIYISGTGG
jgi:hypothetical protein